MMKYRIRSGMAAKTGIRIRYMNINLSILFSSLKVSCSDYYGFSFLFYIFQSGLICPLLCHLSVFCREGLLNEIRLKVFKIDSI